MCGELHATSAAIGIHDKDVHEVICPVGEPVAVEYDSRAVRRPIAEEARVIRSIKRQLLFSRAVGTHAEDGETVGVRKGAGEADPAVLAGEGGVNKIDGQ